LLERARSDDPAAWTRLVDLYAPLVAYWCRRWGLRDEDRADVLQDVFQAVAAHVGDFQKQKDGDTFRGWLRTITLNKVRDHFRKRGHEPSAAGGTEVLAWFGQVPSPQPGAGSDASRADDPADCVLLHHALERIRCEFENRTWQAFWQTSVEGKAPKDVALDFGMSPGAVRVAKSRVLKRLREELGDLSA
jgi:RNA polymerase sigma-70 factor (ECF subfamily)